MTHPQETGIARGRIAAGATAALFFYIAVDFLIHGVALAGYWKSTAGYWRPPEELFRLILPSYAVFAVVCGVLAWLLARLYGPKLNVATGARFGLVAGLLYSGVGAVGSYCVFRMPASALLLWPLAGTVLAVVACTTAAWTMTALRPWRRVGFSFLIALALLIVGVIAQNLFVPSSTFQR